MGALVVSVLVSAECWYAGACMFVIDALVVGLRWCADALVCWLLVCWLLICAGCWCVDVLKQGIKKKKN